MTNTVLETRSLAETLSETFALFLVMLTLLASPFLAMAGVGRVESALDLARSGGEELFGQLGWAVGTSTTVLLSFYVVVYGGQIIDAGTSAARIRRLLAGVSELMAAATAVLLVCVAVYCIQAPRHWAVMVVLVPAVGIVVFLAVQLGRFLLADVEVRRAEAKRLRDDAKGQLAKLGPRSRLRFAKIFVANSVGISAIATGVAVLMEPMPVNLADRLLLTAGVMGLYAVVTAFLLGGSAFAMNEAMGTTSRWATPITIGLTAIFFGLVVLGALSYFLQGNLGMAVAYVVVVVLSAVTTYSPLLKAPRALVNWSIHGGVARLHAKELVRIYARTAREYRALRPVPDAAPAAAESPSVLRRLLVRLGDVS